MVSQSGATIKEINNIMYIGNSELEFGILVDNIIGTTEISTDLLQKEVSTITEIEPKYIEGVTKAGVVVLNIKEILAIKTLVVNESI